MINETLNSFSKNHYMDTRTFHLLISVNYDFTVYFQARIFGLVLIKRHLTLSDGSFGIRRTKKVGKH